MYSYPSLSRLTHPSRDAIMYYCWSRCSVCAQRVRVSVLLLSLTERTGLGDPSTGQLSLHRGGRGGISPPSPRGVGGDKLEARGNPPATDGRRGRFPSRQLALQRSRRCVRRSPPPFPACLPRGTCRQRMLSLSCLPALQGTRCLPSLVWPASTNILAPEVLGRLPREELWTHGAPGQGHYINVYLLAQARVARICMEATRRVPCLATTYHTSRRAQLDCIAIGGPSDIYICMISADDGLCARARGPTDGPRIVCIYLQYRVADPWPTHGWDPWPIGGAAPQRATGLLGRGWRGPPQAARVNGPGAAASTFPQTSAPPQAPCSCKRQPLPPATRPRRRPQRWLP